MNDNAPKPETFEVTSEYVGNPGAEERARAFADHLGEEIDETFLAEMKAEGIDPLATLEYAARALGQAYARVSCSIGSLSGGYEDVKQAMVDDLIEQFDKFAAAHIGDETGTVTAA